MTNQPFPQPQTDPTPIFEHYRGSYGTELLAAAVSLDLFSHLAHAPMSLTALRSAIGLAERPATVLLVAMRAMGLITGNWPDRLELTPIAREHLLPGGAFYVGDYVGLSAESPGVLEMVRRLKQNTATPEKTDTGAATTAFTFREGAGDSAMDHEASARKLTLALAGRAKNVAPAMAAKLSLAGVKTLLDVGGGTGIYSLALLRANPGLKAVIWDRAEVLKVAREFAEEHQLLDRVELRPGDMFAGDVPQGCDAILLSNILHDWDVPECRVLVKRLAEALPPGGRLLIHDVFLNDTMDGPLPLALYSAALFSVTEGRAYSGAEYRAMLTDAGLSPEPVVPTLVHCGVLAGVKQ